VLEERLSKQPPGACEYCGELAMRKISSRIMGGANKWREDEWSCGKCRKIEMRVVYFK
jgi:hypothetical protein